MDEFHHLNSEELLKMANDLPRKAGCYLMHNKRGEVIYVGKAKDLKARVTTYFNNSAKNPKTLILVTHIVYFEFFLTAGETEALVLENNLIKKYSPKYNIRLRDDKSYPYVVINWAHSFPRLQYVRRAKKGPNIEIFGPFVVGSNISEVLRIITKTFALRDCTNQEFLRRLEPCLLYQMKQCSAPCVSKISKDEYRESLKMALSFFNGKAELGIREIKNKMEKFSESEHFEICASLRDYLKILEEFVAHSKQKNAELFAGEKNIDTWSFYIGEKEVDLGPYLVRNSCLVGNKNFHFSKIECEFIETSALEEQVAQFILQYYSQTTDSYPDVVVTPFKEEIINSLGRAVKEILPEAKIEFRAAKRKYQSLMKLAFDFNYEQQRVRNAQKSDTQMGAYELAKILELSEAPKIIECYDIAIWQGRSPTASQVVFYEGKADKKSYRHYHLKIRPEGNNDFAMMKEVIERRLDNGPLPDLFVVDGGKGQLNVFLEVLKDKKIEIPTIALAKAKTKSDSTSDIIKKSEERIFIPGRANPIILKNNKALMKLLVSMRDEAHRFSRILHHKSEKKRLIN